MQTDLMFCVGFNPTHSHTLAELVKSKGKMNWYEIEAQLYLERYKVDKLPRAMFVYECLKPQPIMPLSGPLLVLTRKKTVLDTIDAFLHNNSVICFTELRHVLWKTSDEGRSAEYQENYWLDIEFSPSPSPGDGPQFKAELTVLDHKMQPYPTSF